VAENSLGQARHWEPHDESAATTLKLSHRWILQGSALVAGLIQPSTLFADGSESNRKYHKESSTIGREKSLHVVN